MRLNKTFKKIFAAIMVVAMICSVMNIFSNKITANASTNPVQMYCTDLSFSKYGICSYQVYIQVDANSAKNKTVYLHHSTSDGWVDKEATFLTKLDNNTEIWVAGAGGTQSDHFVIKYVGDGITYWDNNNGQDYDLNDVVGAANVKALRRHSSSPYTIRAVVKNLGYEKHVKVRYTLDNWQTYQDVNLSYVSSGYGINGELWAVDLDLDQNNLDGFQFCICYEVNGQTYWDNNFGANYDKNYYRAY